MDEKISLPFCQSVAPDYLVQFRPNAALRDEIAEVLTGLDVAAITEPPQETITVDEMLVGLQIAFEQALDERVRRCAVQRVPEDVDGPLFEVHRMFADGPMPADLPSVVLAAFTEVRSRILGELRAYRDSQSSGYDPGLP